MHDNSGQFEVKSEATHSYVPWSRKGYITIEKEFEKPGAFILQLRWIRVVKIKRVECKNETRKQYTVQATADTRSTNSAVVSASACHQMDPGSNLSGGSLGRKLTMGTDERQESYTDDEYNSESAHSIDACL